MDRCAAGVVGLPSCTTASGPALCGQVFHQANCARVCGPRPACIPACGLSLLQPHSQIGRNSNSAFSLSASIIRRGSVPGRKPPMLSTLQTADLRRHEMVHPLAVNRVLWWGTVGRVVHVYTFRNGTDVPASTLILREQLIRPTAPRSGTGRRRTCFPSAFTDRPPSESLTSPLPNKHVTAPAKGFGASSFRRRFALFPTTSSCSDRKSPPSTPPWCPAMRKLKALLCLCPCDHLGSPLRGSNCACLVPRTCKHVSNRQPNAHPVLCLVAAFCQQSACTNPGTKSAEARGYS